MTNAISMDGLTKHYKGVQALTDLTLDVPAGTRSSASSGRTAPARPPRSRSWPVSPARRPAARPSTASPVSAAGDHRRQLGYLAQDPRFYGWMTGRETLRYVARFRGIGADRERQIDAPARAGRHRRRGRPADVDLLGRACASGSASPRPSSAGRP